MAEIKGNVLGKTLVLFVKDGMMSVGLTWEDARLGESKEGELEANQLT